MLLVQSSVLLWLVVALAGRAQSQAATSEWVNRVVALSDAAARLSDAPLPHLPFLMSHRSFAAAPAHGAPSQNVSIGQQLALGVRGVELELHLIPEFETSTSGVLRVCHSPRTTAIADQCGAVGWPLCEAIGIPRLSAEDLGCQAKDPSLTAVLREVVAWLAAQPPALKPLVLLSLTSRVTANDSAIDDFDVSSLVERAFRDSGAFSLTVPAVPGGAGVFPNRSRADALGTPLFAVWQHAHIEQRQRTAGIAPTLIWPAVNLAPIPASDVTPYAAVCTPGSSTYADFAAIAGLQVVFEDTATLRVYPTGPPLYNPADVYGALSPGRVATAISCGQTLAFDFVSPARLADGVWSFAVDEPSPTTPHRCVRMNTTTGRWHADDCSRTLPFACQRPTSDSVVARVGVWSASASTAAWSATAGGAACAVGSSHSLPINSLQNSALRSIAAGAGVAELWLDMHRPMSDWQPFYARSLAGAAGLAPSVAGSTPAAMPIRPAPTPLATGTAAPVVLTNGAGFPVTGAGGSTYVVPVLTATAPGTDRNGAPATATRTNPIVTQANGSPRTVSPGVVETEPDGLPSVPVNMNAKRFALGFDNRTLFGSKPPPMVAELPDKPATSWRYAFFTPPDDSTGLQKDEFCSPDAAGDCQWLVYAETVAWPSAVPFVLAVLAFPLLCCGFWIAWACCMSGSEPAEETCCPREYFDDTGAYYYTSQIRFVMLGLVLMSAICAIITVPVLVGTTGVRAAEQQVTATFLEFVDEFKGEVVDLATQLLELRELTRVDPGRERVLRDRIIAEVNRQANVSVTTTAMVRDVDGQLHSATLAIMLCLLISLVLCGIGGGVCRSIALSYALGCTGFIFICLCWLLFAVHYTPAVAIADFCQVYAAPNNPSVGIGGLLRDTIYCESVEAQTLLTQITTDYVNAGNRLCGDADRACSRRDAPCPNQPLLRQCAAIDCSVAPPYDSNNTCTVDSLVRFGQNYVTDYGSGCTSGGNLSLTVARCDNNIGACMNSAAPCEPKPVVLERCPTECRSAQLRNMTAGLQSASASMQRINDTLALLRQLVACSSSEKLRQEIGTVICGDMYRSLILVYTPCAVLGIFLIVPVMLAVKGIKRFNRDYWKPVAAHQRPPGRYTIGRRRLPGARIPVDGEAQKEPLRPRRQTGHAAQVRPKSAAVLAMRKSVDGGVGEDKKLAASNSGAAAAAGAGAAAAGAAAAARPKPADGEVEKSLRMSTLDIKARKALNRQTAPPSSAARFNDSDDSEGGSGAEMAEMRPASPRKEDRRKTVAVQPAAAAAAIKVKQPQRHSMAPTSAAAVKQQQQQPKAAAKPRTATEMATTLPTVGHIEPSGRYDELLGASDIGDAIFDAVQTAPELSSSIDDDDDDGPPPPAVPRSLSASSVSGGGGGDDDDGMGDLPEAPPMFGDSDSDV